MTGDWCGAVSGVWGSALVIQRLAFSTVCLAQIAEYNWYLSHSSQNKFPTGGYNYATGSCLTVVTVTLFLILKGRFSRC